MSLMQTVRRVAVVVAILVVPSVFYLLLRTGKNNFSSVPVYGPREAPAVAGGDTIYHTIGDFSLVNQAGNPISAATYDNHILVTCFFFASCQTICPKMNMQMKRLQEEYKNDPRIRLLSVTVNPERDSVPVLARYAEEYGAVSGKWDIATGDKKIIYDLARNGYFLTAMPGDGGPDDFIHSEKLVLIDKEKRIRGYYDGTDYLEVNKLIEDIVALEHEYKAAVNH